MKKYWMLSGAILLVALMAVPSAFAVPVSVGDTIKFVYSPAGSSDRYLNGGVFTATDITSSPQFTFKTFCLERNEYLATSQVGSIDTFAYLGGRNGGPQDEISKETAWLYETYSNANYKMIRFSSPATEGNLQEAIWYLEQELVPEYEDHLGIIPATLPTGLSAGAISLIKEAVGATANYVNRSIRVLNLITKDSLGVITNRQSMLVNVPEPATLLLLGFSMLGLGFAARRKHRNIR